MRWFPHLRRIPRYSANLSDEWQERVRRQLNGLKSWNSKFRVKKRWLMKRKPNGRALPRAWIHV